MSNNEIITRGRTLDHVAKLYDTLVPIMTLGRTNFYFRQSIAAMELESSHRILDIGCATGHLSEFLGKYLDAEKGGQIVGIDAAHKMIDQANSKNIGPWASFDTVAAESLPYEDESFDKVTSLFFFHHVDYELKVACLNEAYRVLKPGGSFILIDIDKPTNWFGTFIILCGEKLFRQPEIKENRLGFLKKAIDECQFKEVELLKRWNGYVSMYKLVKPL